MSVILSRRSVVLALAATLALGLAGATARADDEAEDHETAQRALQAGRVRPLAEIRADVAAALGGRIVGVELEEKAGRYVYEFKVITPGGRLREIYVDGLTGAIISDGDD